MNTWGYLILIAALLLLAAAMLYARFASRSREKSLHHSPVELMFPADSISAARSLENETGKIDLPRGKKAAVQVKVDRVDSPTVSTDEVEGETKKRESDYFDDLQEAAAGLAMLMRSSPVGRTEPVIYAPEEVEADVEIEVDTVVVIEAEGGLEEIAVSEEVEVCAESGPVPEELVADIPVEEAVNEGAVADEIETDPVIGPEPIIKEAGALVSGPGECEVSLPAEVRVLTMREILGDQVSDRIDLIDEGLDALESLVRSIESSLRALDSVDLIDEDEDLAETDAAGTIVSEAA
jgi:hypothetical protein